MAATPWLELVHEYSDRTIRLDIWRVQEYRGEVVAREGQECRWVTVSQLEGIDLLAADRPIVDALLREPETGH